MPIETEYTRTYRPIVSSPHPSSPPIPAGISSAKQWITQEPPVGLKKKPLHENRVTFLTDGGDDQGNSNQEIKSLKFKAGLRRPFTGVPTEYQRQFQWHEPTPKETPLLNNQHTHHSSKYPTTVRTSNRDSSQGICNQCQHRGDQHQTRQDQSESTDSEDVIIPQEDPTNTHQQVNNKKKLSPRKADKYDVHGQKQKNFIQDLMSKQSERKAQIAKNAHKKMIRHFVTEYQRQFGKSNSKKAKKNKAKFDGSPIAGVPRALTDSSDPRLLKHSPLPISTALTSSLPTGNWTTNYRANYTSPSDSEFVGGAAHSSPQLERRTRMSPLTAVDEQTEHPLPITTFSWHDQLVELREKAERYKKRAEGVSIRRLLPLTRQDLIDNNPPSSTITDFTSCATSSPTPSDSVSCTFSDCPHHHRDSRSPPRQAPASAGPTVWASRSPPRAPTSAGPTVWASISPPEHARTTAGPTVRASRPRGSMQVHNGSSTQVHDMEEDNSEIESIHHIPGPPFQPKTLESDTGRVQTPVIQISSSDYRRHHLYRTTPVAGGLFISPKKVPELILPYPPVSPKFRRDMKSSALINPAPKKTKEKYVQVDEGSSSQTTDQDYMPPMVTSSVTQPPVIVPISSSPYHTRCAPVTTSKSTSVRKLDFKARSQPKSATSKTMPKPYSHRVEGVRPTSNSSCNICGSCLRPHSSTANAGTTSSRLRSGLSSNLAGGGLSTLKNPQVSVASTLPYTSQQPAPSTNFMTRLPPQAEARARDSDEISLASLSLSSCSIASDVLRKARERRDHFWSHRRQ